MNSPAPMAREGVHETVADLLKAGQRGRVLDIPAGYGALAVRLKELGFEVFASDLYPQIFVADAIEIKAGNLDGRLPYDDQMFDHVVCVEGLEHIESPANAIREFSRLLKPSGTLVISVPNIMNIEERLKWLFGGYTSHFKPLSSAVRADIEKEYGGMEEIALHVNPIGYSEVRFLLESNGFELESVHRDAKKKNSWLFLPIVAIVRLIAAFSSEVKRREKWTDELNADEVLLGGNTLIFKAKKL